MRAGKWRESRPTTRCSKRERSGMRIAQRSPRNTVSCPRFIHDFLQSARTTPGAILHMHTDVYMHDVFCGSGSDRQCIYRERRVCRDDQGCSKCLFAPSYTTLVLYLYQTYIILILYLYYTCIILILYLYYTYTILILYLYYTCITYYTYTILILYLYYTYIRLILYLYYTYTILVLYLYYTYVVILARAFSYTCST